LGTAVLGAFLEQCKQEQPVNPSANMFWIDSAMQSWWRVQCRNFPTSVALGQEILWNKFWQRSGDEIVHSSLGGRYYIICTLHSVK
jgi:hypothetical protein